MNINNGIVEIITRAMKIIIVPRNVLIFVIVFKIQHECKNHNLEFQRVDIIPKTKNFKRSHEIFHYSWLNSMNYTVPRNIELGE